jgi:hypothetical protein
MSGRSGYRKTDRKRHRSASPRPASDYILRFKLPAVLAFSVSQGQHGYGVVVGFNDVVFVHGQSPAHCAQLAADFLNGIGARQVPGVISASVVKLLPCPAHSPFRQGGFRKLGVDLEAIHDCVSRNARNWRPCSIVIGADAITVSGATPRPLVHDFAGRPASDRRRA